MYNECIKVQNPPRHEFMPLWTDFVWRHDQWQLTKLNSQLTIFSASPLWSRAVGQDHVSLIFAESSFIMYVVSIENIWGIS